MHLALQIVSQLGEEHRGKMKILLPFFYGSSSQANAFAGPEAR
jgi:hypothetical protein